MANAIRTNMTYKTYLTALKALAGKMPNPRGEKNPTLQLQDVRYLIAATPEGRYAPVLIGVEYVPYAQLGITVVG